MSDTPMLDAVDAAYRKQRGILEAPSKADDRTPEQIEAEARKWEEERMERNSPAQQRIRKARAQRYSTVKRALYEVTESIRHGDDLSTAEREAVAAKLVKDLGLPQTEVLAFVEVAASHIADGDKASAWKSAERTADVISNSEWRPPVKDQEDTRSMEEILAKIPGVS